MNVWPVAVAPESIDEQRRAKRRSADADVDDVGHVLAEYLFNNGPHGVLPGSGGRSVCRVWRSCRKR